MRHRGRNGDVLGQPVDLRNVRFGLRVQHGQLPGLRFGDRDRVHRQSIPLCELSELPERLLWNFTRYVARLLRRMHLDRKLHWDVARYALRVFLQHHSGCLCRQRLHVGRCRGGCLRRNGRTLYRQHDPGCVRRRFGLLVANSGLHRNGDALQREQHTADVSIRRRVRLDQHELLGDAHGVQSSDDGGQLPGAHGMQLERGPGKLHGRDYCVRHDLLAGNVHDAAGMHLEVVVLTQPDGAAPL